jgi:hypothetical protein
LWANSSHDAPAFLHHRSLDSPRAIAVDNQGRVVVRDVTKIVIYDNAGHFLKTLDLPQGFVVTAYAFSETNDLYLLGDDKKVYKVKVSA